MNNQSIDLDNVEPIEKSYRRSQDYDLRYSGKQDKFKVSDSFYEEHNMDENGFTLNLAESGSILLLSIQSKEESVMFKGEGNSFSSSEFSSRMKEQDMLNEGDQHTNLYLTFVGERKGKPFYSISPQEESKSASEENSEIVDESPATDLEESDAPQSSEGQSLSEL